jgi:DNA polymerase-3 subunit delta
MKLARGAVGRALDRPDPSVRFYLFHGSDEGQSRSHAHRLLASLGGQRSVIGGASLKSDPALLASEAGALNLFGERRLLWVEPAGEEIAESVAALLDASSIESPVAAVAGALKKSSTLLKLVEGSPTALSYASYVPEGQDAERMVAEVGRTLGLKINSSVSARVGAACGNDQSIVRKELEKLALYVDASTESPKELDHDALDHVGADLPEGNFSRLADIALVGRTRDLADALSELGTGGAEAIPVLRALQRRLLMLAPARARVERGQSPADVMAAMGNSLFFKEKPLVGTLLHQWSATSLATIFERCGMLEREIMLTPTPPIEALAEELMTIARATQQR